MRPNTDTAVKRQGNLSTETVDMGIDADSIQHLMSVLTSLYSDPVMATIREYATNAIDSHKAAGNPDPIEITLPTSMNPTYVVQDYGVGMSPDDIRDIYSQYGASTKRDNDDEAGMFGLGCKAALAYTNEFTIDAVKDGVRTLATMSYGQDGTGKVNIIDTKGTDKPNGVKIKVPVNRPWDFERKAREFFRFWTDPVLVDGEKPEPIDGTKVTDNIEVANDVSSDYVVMGNIGYPVKQEFAMSRDLGRSHNVVAQVDMGDVVLAPSREALQYTDLTKRTLARLRSVVNNKTLEAAENHIDDADDEAEAIKRYFEWDGVMPSHRDLQYKGQDIPRQFSVEDDEQWRVFTPRRSAAKEVDTRYRISLRDVLRYHDYIVIENYPNKSFTRRHKNKIEKYLDINDIDYDRIVVCETRPGGKWWPNDKVYDWADVDKVQVGSKRSSGSSGKSMVGKYNVWNGNKYVTTPADQISGDVAYYSPTDYDGEVNPRTVASAFPDRTIICMGKNRMDKFQREYPDESDHVKNLIEDRVDEVRDNMKPNHLAYHHRSHRLPKLQQRFGRIDPDDLHDDRLTKIIRIARNMEAHAGWSHVSRVYQYYNGLTPDLDTDTIEDAMKVLDEYPLISEVSRYGDNASALMEYVNALYNERNGA